MQSGNPNNQGNDPYWRPNPYQYQNQQYPYQQPPYQPPPPPGQYQYPQPQPHRYRGWVLASLVIGYLFSLVLLVTETGVTSGIPAANNTSNSNPGILGYTCTILLIVINISIMVLDRRSFFTLFGKIQWKRLKVWQRIGLGFLYLGFFIMPAFYLFSATKHFLSVRQQTLGQAFGYWYRSKSQAAQIGIGAAFLLLTISIITFTSLGAIADRSSALLLLTPTAAPQQAVLSDNPTAPAPTHAAVATTLTSKPTAILTLKPTPVPTQAVQPTQPPATPTSCPGINCNPWNYNFNPGNYITNPPSNFCNYFSCITSFWEPDDPDGGYVVQCSDGLFSQSGGERGACSYHGGVMRPLYSH